MGRKPQESASAKLLGNIASRGHEPSLERVKGTVRLDLAEEGARDDRWFVKIDDGDLSVSRKNGSADLTIQADRAVFDGIASGKDNAVAAFLRGEVEVTGDWELLVLFQRLLPAPSRPTPRKRATASGRKT